MTDNLFAPQVRGGIQINKAQLAALTEDTSLVTFGTIGGNDIGLVGLAQGCLAPGSCVPAEGDDPLAAKFVDVEEALDRGIDDTQALAPGARIVVVGYGTYLPPGGCVDAFGGLLAVEEFDYVQSQIDRLSDLLEKVAGEQGVDFVDMRDIPFSLDHTACAAPEKQWIRAINTYDDGAPLHPSRCGMDAMFQHLHRELVGAGAPDFDSSCVSAGPAPAPAADPTPTTTPTPAATQPSQAEVVRRDLLAQAGSLRLTTRCTTGSNGRRFVLRVRGRAPDAALARFAVGTRKAGVDTRTPLRTTRLLGRRAWKGKAVAKVKLERAGVTVWHRLEAPRPRCLR